MWLTSNPVSCLITLHSTTAGDAAHKVADACQDNNGEYGALLQMLVHACCALPTVCLFSRLCCANKWDEMANFQAS